MIDFDKSKWLLDQSDFERDEKSKDIIGGYTSTQLYTQKSTNRKCTIDKTKETLKDEATKRNYKRSISILATNQHPAIIPFVGFYEINNYGCTVLEEKEESLSDLLDKTRKGFKVNPLFDDTHKLIIMYGISCAMEFLHNKLVIHRNLKPSHIKLDSELHPFLSGFYVAKKIDPSVKINKTLSGTTATIMAPEFITDPEHYSNSLPIDVYAYGITIYELITAIAPFSHIKGAYKIFRAVCERQRPEIPSSVPEQYVDLITMCWDQNPDERPTFTEICDLLESDEFLNDPKIDRELFEDYKKLVYPFRPSKARSKEINEMVEKLTKDLKESQNQIKELQQILYGTITNSTKEDNAFIDDEERKNYETIKKIGEGATSIVYKIVDTRTGENLCKKVLKISDESSLFTNAKNAIKEFEALYTIKHPCICRAIGINTSEPINDDDQANTTIALYLEFLSRNLKECIDKNILDNTLKVRIAIEMAHALNFIHKHGMIHRDIKIENIMMNSIFESKIVDFGLVRIDECVNGETFVQTSMTKGIGTLSYMSPEMINEENYDSKTDVYSYGIVLHYLFIGKLPVYSMRDLINGKPIPLPKPSSSITEFGIEMITKCTNHTPSKRPSFEEILKDIRAHSFSLAPEIDQALIIRRDRELSFYESQKS